MRQTERQRETERNRARQTETDKTHFLQRKSETERQRETDRDRQRETETDRQTRNIFFTNPLYETYLMVCE